MWDINTYNHKQSIKINTHIFTGWEGQTTENSRNSILKQLKNNLQHYEKNYLQNKQIQNKIRSQSKKGDLIEKQNLIKFPILGTSYPNRHKRDYSAFLQSQLPQQSGKIQSVLYLKEVVSPRLPSCQEKIANIRSESIAQLYKSNQQSKQKNIFLKKHRIYNISKTLKLSKLMDRRSSTTKLIHAEIPFQECSLKHSREIS